MKIRVGKLVKTPRKWRDKPVGWGDYLKYVLQECTIQVLLISQDLRAIK